MIKVLVSDDGDSWHSATYLEELEIGNSTGETNIIPFVEGSVTARYVRVDVTTPHSDTIYGISLAELGLY